jgi:hypothetical protein
MFKIEYFDSKTALGLDYSLSDWFEDLKRWYWDKKQLISVEENLEKWIEHFIGEGYYYKISNHVDKIVNSMNNADVNFLKEYLGKIIEVHTNTYSIKKCLLYGDYENVNDKRFNGALYSNNEKQHINILIHILKDILSPIVSICETQEQLFVTDKKYQLSKFDIINYKLATSDFKNRKLYSIENLLEMNQPGIVINIGNSFTTSIANNSFSLSRLENDFDKYLPYILTKFDYQEIIWDLTRGQRMFSSHRLIDNYDLKIILNT